MDHLIIKHFGNNLDGNNELPGNNSSGWNQKNVLIVIITVIGVITAGSLAIGYYKKKVLKPKDNQNL